MAKVLDFQAERRRLRPVPTPVRGEPPRSLLACVRTYFNEIERLCEPYQHDWRRIRDMLTEANMLAPGASAGALRGFFLGVRNEQRERHKGPNVGRVAQTCGRGNG